jgi:Tol biopolymer transport system component
MKNRINQIYVLAIILLSIIALQCKKSAKTVPHQEKWGIYELELATENTELIYSSAKEIQILRMNNSGDKFVFDQKIDGEDNENMEICVLGVDGNNFQRITNNTFWDLYPVWSPEGTRIAFLSKRENDLDIYLMEADGSNINKFFDSGSNDADIDWQANKIVFTSGFKIWSINDDGTIPTQLTNPANAGQWGNANLPIGDYDPRFNPDGSKVVFERLEDPSSTHGNYNIFVINSDGTDETRLTNNGYAQGLANWSNSGTHIVYIVAAINNEGKYDIYQMKADGADNQNITPDYFPSNFLCHSPVFSKDDSKIFFIGEWWE